VSGVQQLCNLAPCTIWVPSENINVWRSRATKVESAGPCGASNQVLDELCEAPDACANAKNNKQEHLLKHALKNAFASFQLLRTQLMAVSFLLGRGQVHKKLTLGGPASC